jgi:hypothetical protein
VRAEQSGRHSEAIVGREEMTSPTDRQRNDVMHRVVAGRGETVVACGADMAVGRQR